MFYNFGAYSLLNSLVYVVPINKKRPAGYAVLMGSERDLLLQRYDFYFILQTYRPLFSKWQGIRNEKAGGSSEPPAFSPIHCYI